MPLSPADDLLIHQTAETFDYVFTSDRNFYDRYYFNLHPLGDELFLIAGMGQYPNLGTTDAFVSISHGDTLSVVRASRELGSDRLDTRVGPLHIEVLEGLKKLRVACDENEWGIAFDLIFEGNVPAIEEPPTFERRYGRVTTNTSRYSQVGSYRGHLEIGGVSYDVTPDRWRGARDHSWGVRGVGEPEPPGIRVKSVAEGFGFFHTWIPMNFDDYMLKVFVEEDQHGNRLVEESIRVASFARGGGVEQMGTPRHHFAYQSGSRELAHALIEVEDPDGKTLRATATPVRTIYLAAGSGYIPKPDWAHGMYQGALKVEGLSYDLGDAASRQGPLYETLCRFELDTGEVTYGLLENLSVGVHRPYGFDDPGAVAP